MDKDKLIEMCKEAIENLETETSQCNTQYEKAMQLVAENRRKAKTYSAIANEIEDKARYFKKTVDRIAEKKADFEGMLNQIHNGGQSDEQKMESIEQYIQGNVVKFELIKK